jgi:heptosyltransferase-2
MEVLNKEKILVIQTAFIGDAVLTLPMIQRLKELFPQSLIDVVATPVSAGLFSASPFVNKVFALDKKGKDKSLLSMFKFGLSLRKEKYSRIYSPHRSFRSSLIVLLSGAANTFGFNNSSFSFVYKNLIRYNSKVHEVKRNLSLIGDEDGDWHIFPYIKSDNATINNINNLLANIPNSNKLAAIAPGSVWQTKKYPKEKYIEIIKFLIENSFTVLLIGSASDQSLCSEIADSFTDNVISLAGAFPVVGSIELLRKCRILICNDSAPTHFGVCAGIPVLTVFCSTVPEFGFYPYNEQSRYLSFDSLKCKPCGIHGLQKCPQNTFDCAYLLDINLIKKNIIEMAGG